MRPFPVLSFLACAVAASVQRRQGHVVTIDRADTSGSFCGPGAVSMTIGPSGDVLEVGFEESRLLTPSEGPASGDCSIEVSMTYPPGCTSALIDVGVHVYLEGVEGITGIIDVATSLSTGGQSTQSGVYQNNEGEELEQVYDEVWPIDASVSVSGEEAAEVVLTIQVDSRIENADGTEGEFILDNVSVFLSMSSLDPTGESCV